MYLNRFRRGIATNSRNIFLILIFLYNEFWVIITSMIRIFLNQKYFDLVTKCTFIIDTMHRLF